ncbi:MAG TPA: hypothetical protein VMI30_08980 [Stellaceae bacterium]|nr:hypothetical protein [Stellaceae bacterium]
MRRLLMILPSLVVLAACADGPPPVSNIPETGVTANFPPGAVNGVIHIAAVEREPLRAAELVAPDGSTTPAGSLDVDANPQRIGGQYAVTDPWRASGWGTNGINPLPTGALDPTVRSRNELLEMVSTADITLPDPVAYRQDWRNYKIRLSFAGAGDQLDVREIPAPAPPPEPKSGAS